jgi:hypothetical protein
MKKNAKNIEKKEMRKLFFFLQATQTILQHLESGQT